MAILAAGRAESHRDVNAGHVAMAMAVGVAGMLVPAWPVLPVGRFTALGTRDDRTAAAMALALSSSDDRAEALARFAEAISPDDADLRRRALCPD